MTPREFGIGMAKLAVVPTERKQLRRAMQLLHEGDTAWHGTGALKSILEAKKLEEGGGISAYGPGVYFSKGRPESTYWSEGGFGVPSSRIEKHFGSITFHPQGDAKTTWMLTPHNVPLEPKDVLITAAKHLPEVEENVRKMRLRTIPSETFNVAKDILSGSEPLEGAVDWAKYKAKAHDALPLSAAAKVPFSDKLLSRAPMYTSIGVTASMAALSELLRRHRLKNNPELYPEQPESRLSLSPEVGYTVAGGLLGGLLGRGLMHTPLKNYAGRWLPTLGASLGAATGGIVGQVKGMNFDADWRFRRFMERSERAKKEGTKFKDFLPTGESSWTYPLANTESQKQYNNVLRRLAGLSAEDSVVGKAIADRMTTGKDPESFWLRKANPYYAMFKRQYEGKDKSPLVDPTLHFGKKPSTVNEEAPLLRQERLLEAQAG